ncbi:MAG: hypothetical protein KKF48_00315 [Nanoarchaeota archaeon]|nr:hypothetical protein [Nanoarchaeota archaeon]MBU1027468.1 hypothetical protein [Nanoarchaeota archaeon]
MQTQTKIIWKIFFIFMAVLIIISILFFLKGDDTNDILKKITQNIFENNKDNQKTTSDSDNTQEIITSSQDQSSSSGGGGGGESSSSESSSLDLECTGKEISYSIINKNKTSICNYYSGDICIDKTVNCYAEIYNRDTTINGLFKIELRFLKEEENQENALEIITKEFFLNAQEHYVFEDYINIQSTGENGSANKEIYCFFNSIIIPRKCT